MGIANYFFCSLHLPLFPDSILVCTYIVVQFVFVVTYIHLDDNFDVYSWFSFRIVETAEEDTNMNSIVAGRAL